MSPCSDPPSAAASGGGSGSIVGEEFMLFGVRVKVDPMRKSVSMNNLSEYEPVSNTSNPCGKRGNELPPETAEGGGAAGYGSADDAVPRPSIGSRERKRGVPWTEEEHKLFLIGLKKVGKGDWRGISRNYVKTRTSTQVASHAQKYFLRRSNLTRRRRRSSLFDITADSVTAVSGAEVRNQQDSPAEPVPQPSIEPRPVVPFPVTGAPVLLPLQGGNPIGNPALFVCPVPVLPVASASTMVDLNINQPVTTDPSPLSLSLSLSSWQDQSLTRDSAFQAVSGFKNGDGTVTVA